MTVKVFHGENEEGHIIYKKEKQQGEQVPIILYDL